MFETGLPDFRPLNDGWGIQPIQSAKTEGENGYLKTHILAGT